jgi:murein DD-endopeptidase MepM/ murein hydrolase activator NlpD
VVKDASAAVLVVTAIAAAACRPAAADPSPGPARSLDVLLRPDSEILSAVVPPRATLASLLKAHNLVADEVLSIIDSVSQKFDLRRFKAGQRYRLDRFIDGRVRAFEYEIDLDRRVLVRRSDTATASFAAEVAAIPKTIERVVVEGAIDRDSPSLIEAVAATGERIELSLALAELFSGEIDFNNDLQPGDTFRMIVERGTREDGEFAGYGPILAAEFVNSGKALPAVRFSPPGGKPGYYDLEGRSLKRLLLKSPLKFELPRITSAFSRGRRHPILNYTRAHNGVDYAAPTGAAVAAVAPGVVMVAGWTGGGGRTVRVRHGSGYESEYLHLSSIAVRRGERVDQGQLIGRVGATGLATGPHLHYGLRRNGAYVNPVREHQNMPPGEPVATVHHALFQSERDQLFDFLGSGATRRADAGAPPAAVSPLTPR